MCFKRKNRLFYPRLGYPIIVNSSRVSFHFAPFLFSPLSLAALHRCDSDRHKKGSLSSQPRSNQGTITPNSPPLLKPISLIAIASLHLYIHSRDITHTEDSLKRAHPQIQRSTSPISFPYPRACACPGIFQHGASRFCTRTPKPNNSLIANAHLRLPPWSFCC